jgi:hypothetical protein
VTPTLPRSSLSRKNASDATIRVAACGALVAPSGIYGRAALNCVWLTCMLHDHAHANDGLPAQSEVAEIPQNQTAKNLIQ